jgi:predicted NBD/HSP70 family sugar kinase
VVTDIGGSADAHVPRHTPDFRVRVLEALMFRPPTRRIELSERLDLSPAIVSKELAPLVAAGVVTQSVEDARHRSLRARGRPPVYVSLAADALHAVGIEIGSRALRVVVCDLSGAIVASQAVPWFPVDARMTIERVCDLTARGLAEAAVGLDRVVGVGVSSAQPVAFDRAASGAFASWKGVNLAAELERRIGIQTAVERASIAGALAEQRFGAGNGASDLVYVRLSAGCGVGVIMGGVAHRGASGVAGEVGHVASTAGRRPCYCGRHGCLETIGSPEAVAGLLGEVYAKPTTVPQMFELVRGADARARRIITEVGGLIGAALVGGLSFVNPSMCIIGGELSMVGDPLVSAIRREIVRRATPGLASGLTVIASQRGREAEVLGAALMQLAHAPGFLARRVTQSAADAMAWEAEE